jgi:hypothetical protein
MTPAPEYVPDRAARLGAQALAEAESFLLAAVPPEHCLDAIHEALSGLARAAGLLANGCRHPARMELEDPDTLRALDDAFPPGSPEADALGVILSAVGGMAAGSEAAA